MTEHEHHGEARGIAYVASSYLIWGVTPLFWVLLDGISPLELTLHRMVWCALFGLAVTAGRGRLSRLVGVLRAPRLVGALAVSGVLITVNWTLFIYCVATRRLVDASLGYYITPLVSIALGVVLLGEKISRIRLAAIGLAGVAVAIETLALGRLPWPAFGLAVSFGFYGYVRKLTPVDSLDGLTVETVLFLPVTLAILAWWALQGTGAFPSPALGRDALLIVTGPLTALPLAMFASGARRIRMTTLGFLQYISPSITLLVATLLMHEPFARTSAIAFGLIWAALVLVSLEGRMPLLSRRVAE
ncbi:MAG TPA: EamA family transporter RarD [Rhizomicrobium sp.]